MYYIRSRYIAFFDKSKSRSHDSEKSDVTNAGKKAQSVLDAMQDDDDDQPPPPDFNENDVPPTIK